MEKALDQLKASGKVDKLDRHWVITTDPAMGLSKVAQSVLQTEPLKA